MEYRDAIIEKASRGSTIKSSDLLLRTNSELYNESLPKTESTINGIPAAAAFSAANLSAIANQDDTYLNQSGLAVDTYPIGVAVNPVTKKIYATNEFSNSLSSNTMSIIDGSTDSVVVKVVMLILLILELYNATGNRFSRIVILCTGMVQI